MALWIMGAMPDKVTAVGSSIVDPEIGAAGDVDTAVVTLHFADGGIAVIKNSRRAVYGYDQRVELLGSEGLLSAGNLLENTVAKSTTSGVVSAKPEYFVLERYHERERRAGDARRRRECTRGRRSSHSFGQIRLVSRNICRPGLRSALAA
jgi:predicted dehydrogenase